MFLLFAENGTGQERNVDVKAEFAAVVQPLLKTYCLDCHSAKAKKGSLDLERFTSLEMVRKDLKPWQQLIEQLEADEMPPKDKPQPTAEERKRLMVWSRGLLDSEARARAGDPGHVPLRRLSNTEYDCTIRDLTGVDLRPTREFPADGAAGEGFTNAAESLGDISPTLLNKYFLAAGDIADHAVLLPDGLRFSPTKTRRDWTDESTSRLRAFYAEIVEGDGRLQVQRYLEASIRHRDAIASGMVTPEVIAAKEKLNPKYFGILWHALQDKTPSYPLDAIRNRWRLAAVSDAPALAGEIARWQAALWKTTRVGSYVRQDDSGKYVLNSARQAEVDPSAVEFIPLRVTVKPAPGQTEVVLSLASRDLVPAGRGNVVWQRPRFEAAGKPALLLRNYTEFGPAFEVDYPSVFVGSAKYLTASIETASHPSLELDVLAKQHGLDAAFLKRWVEVLAIEPLKSGDAPKTVPAVELSLLEEPSPGNEKKSIKGWRKKGADLPVLVTNSSDKAEQIPGRVSPHAVAVHPLPQEFVAVTWKSPLAANVRVTVRVTHAHPDCGNGVAWWLEHRRAGRATVLGQGTVDLGKVAMPPAKTVKVEKNDVIVLAVDARDGNHSCDLTEIDFIVTTDDTPERVWNLAADVESNILDRNPHADQHGNADTWSFVSGASKATNEGTAVDKLIPADSVLGEWRHAAVDPARQADTAKLAAQFEALLTAPRSEKATESDRNLYDRLLTIDGPLLKGLDVAKLAKPHSIATKYGLPKDRFGPQPGGKPVDEASFVAAANSTTEIRLPAALFAGREFVVDGRLDDVAGDRVVQFRVLTGSAGTDPDWGSGSVLAAPVQAGFKRLIQGNADFRSLFPMYLCYPQVIPNDEVVSLKMFHREDEPLARLFLNQEQQRRLDDLWREHEFISRQAVAENNYLPLFIGFVTQDQPKSLLDFFYGQRPAFQKRADELLKVEEDLIPRQLDALLEFAGRAYRRKLSDQERTDLLALYKTVRGKERGHDDAFRHVLARVLMSPAFLFRIEHAPAGNAPQPINDWELATRLSYFLWSSSPDNELRYYAAARRRLRDPQVLASQVQRMLKDERLRALAIEFGTQWIHVRGFDEFKEKNETLFPTFNANFRKAAYEESILFFQDLFQSDRSVTQILDADYAFLNESLAKHYGIPGVNGPQLRRVEGVRKFGRGGVLGLASVQARQAGASRSSPVLRGNWVVETLLGEKLPRPPADVPRLPEEEGNGGLTVRQQVERHAKSPACATCHVRIDPFGFALEKYDPIGRLRDKDLGGLEVDAKAKLRDGTEFEGIDGLRTYLLTKKKEVVVRLFCRRLLGYALGRAVTLSDTALLDEMVTELNHNEGRVSAAVQTIVRSPQFKMIRGIDYSE
ncbi:MAG: hypothetical protein JWM11_4028 [Planctomycetaceae bacterium]|nr:hypothetical protein [Planctomycetaceae bacterium]